MLCTVSPARGAEPAILPCVCLGRQRRTALVRALESGQSSTETRERPIRVMCIELSPAGQQATCRASKHVFQVAEQGGCL